MGPSFANLSVFALYLDLVSSLLKADPETSIGGRGVYLGGDSGSTWRGEVSLGNVTIRAADPSSPGVSGSRSLGHPTGGVRLLGAFAATCSACRLRASPRAVFPSTLGLQISLAPCIAWEFP